MKKEYRGITRKTQKLLAGGESKFVDYKERLKGLHADDLVAFANSESGGTILIGVKEEKQKNGSQIGIACGCPIGDEEKLQIMAKALSCTPPIKIDVFVENLSKDPFYRIEIQSGPSKPYATNSGTYKIREDGRNHPLLPEQLLSLFLDREGEEFRNRFSQAAGQLEEQMHHTLGVVGDLEHVITSKIEEISSSMGWAEYEASSARSTIEDVGSNVSLIALLANKEQKRMKSLLKHLDASDPVVEEAKKEVLDYLIEHFEEDEDAFEKVKAGGSMSLSGGSVGELNKEILSELLSEAIKHVESGKEDV